MPFFFLTDRQAMAQRAGPDYLAPATFTILRLSRRESTLRRRPAHGSLAFGLAGLHDGGWAAPPTTMGQFESDAEDVSDHYDDLAANLSG